MSREYREYEISTINDIFCKVPAARIPDCMAELGVLLQQAANARDMIISTAREHGQTLDPAKAVKLPSVLTWKDDDCGDISLVLDHKGECIGEINTNMSDHQK